ncbi:MAG: DnaB-like helicase C-terminal domain-containing protein [Candidatus Devosia phytovorans]|uniref:DNA 5'-3' helicase n=1 Tax=Candidatus Devosia phytovorans TaxID=3121372 RepID=A0AAJ5VYE9_9HYPH|nr:DnaB-like helicase C-terminal domain-containing protein [Devosia sp.]WEK05749.1 MAG: DnaB-like helicase C-terminal domain-containing protein [Devosia sp.]
MNAPATFVPLQEVDVELTLLGTLLENDGALEHATGLVKPEWFSEPILRFIFEKGVELVEAGHKPSATVMIATMPTEIAGVTRGAFYARLVAAALPVRMVGGLLQTLKDRWLRRTLTEMGHLAVEQSKLQHADPYEVASNCLSELDVVMEVQAEKSGASLGEAGRQYFEDIRNPDLLKGDTTGLRVLDDKLNGYRRGQLYVVAGRPGMGKSAFMCSSARCTALSGVGVAIFSLEMTRQEIFARMAADEMNVAKAPGFGDLLRGNWKGMDDQIGEAYERLHKVPMHIDDSARLTFAEIAAKARRLKSEMESQGVRLGVIWIDHMGLVTPSNRYAGNKVAEAGEVSGRARALAKELDCCVVLLCQLSREVEKRDDKRPIMSDLRWSGEIEQDAHVIGFLYREEYYLAQNADADPMALIDARWSIEFLIRKNRSGDTADCKLWCSIAHSSIRDNL